jgi:hypothetical protein
MHPEEWQWGAWVMFGVLAVAIIWRLAFTVMKAWFRLGFLPDMARRQGWVVRPRRGHAPPETEPFMRSADYDAFGVLDGIPFHLAEFSVRRVSVTSSPDGESRHMRTEYECLVTVSLTQGLALTTSRDARAAMMEWVHEARERPTKYSYVATDVWSGMGYLSMEVKGRCYRAKLRRKLRKLAEITEEQRHAQ